MATVVSGSTSTAAQSTSAQSQPLYAQGNDWTKNLVHLAKTAELKKHALTLQLHTAHILSAHASLDQKNKAIQDVKEQKNKLDSERVRLLNCLREVNEDRDKADMLEAKLAEEVSGLEAKIKSLSEGEYAAARADVDRLRQELGQQPLPSLQQTLEDKSQQYLKDLRMQTEAAAAAAAALNTPSSSKRGGGGDEGTGADGQPAAKRPRGRPKGSKNSTKKSKNAEGTPTTATVGTPTSEVPMQQMQGQLPMAPLGYA